MLTKKQHELLMFINQRLTATGVAPSFDEMKDALNLRSKSGIHRLISGLEERGFIRRLPHRARALEVVKLPEESAAPVPGTPSRRSGARALLADGDSRRFCRRAAGNAGGAGQRGGRPAAVRPNRRRHADRGVARPECLGCDTGQPDRARRALRARGRRRQHGRSRAFSTATRSSFSAATRPKTARSSSL